MHDNHIQSKKQGGQILNERSSNSMSGTQFQWFLVFNSMEQLKTGIQSFVSRREGKENYKIQNGMILHEQ